ncbi:MAG: hypothetical protein J7K23_00980 [Thermoproteales archaeon]|nr:hypothetical protein [Thermoproteales archaeon]
MSERMQEYLASRTLYTELTGVLIKLAQQKFEQQRKDLQESFGKEISSIGLYARPKSWLTIGIARFVGQELQSRALIKKSYEIAAKKWKEAFGEDIEIPKISTELDDELKAALSAIVMLDTEPSLPEIKRESGLVIKALRREKK